MFGSLVARHRRVAYLLTLLTAIVVVACGAAPYRVAASGPIGYSADVDPSVTRVAVVVTITNVSGDDLAVAPTDFLVRDVAHHVYPADPAAAVADARVVRLAVASGGASQSIGPLPTITLRGNDVLSGFLIFDLPVGVQPVELVWRQSDSDDVIPLSAAH